MEKLTSIKKGKYSQIEKISDDAPLRIKRRLLELGFTKGEKARVVRKSLLSHAYLVEIRGYTLSVRKDIAGYVIVVP